MAKYLTACFFLTRLLTIVAESGDDQLCSPMQTLEFGGSGIITCSFQEDYFGVYWYDTQDLTLPPVLHKEDGKLGGYGYESGEFDLVQDGSLFIRNVTSQYERVFTVVISETRVAETLQHETIEVKVFAYPSVPYPVIDHCLNQQYCYSELRDDPTLKCTVANARPSVYLKWIERTSEGDRDIMSNQTHVTKYGLVTTTATMTYEKSTPPYFGVFVCKAQQDALILQNPASFTLAELGRPNYGSANVNIKEMNVGSLVSLQCNKGNMTYFIWKKAVSQSGKQYKVIAHGYTTIGTKFDEKPYEVDSNGLLLIRSFAKEQEGLYVCYSGNGFREHAESYLITGLGATTYIATTSWAATEADNLSTSMERKFLDAIVICIGIIFPFAGLVLLWIVSKYEKTVSNKDVRRVTTDEMEAQDDPGIPLMCQNFPLNTEDHPNDEEELTEPYLRFVESTVIGLSYKTNIRTYEIGKMVSERNGKMILVLRDDESGEAKTIEDLCFQLTDVKTNESVKSVLAKGDHFQNGQQYSVNWINVYCTCKTIDYDITVIDFPISCCSPGTDDMHLSKITECLHCLMTNDTAYALRQIDVIVLSIRDGCGVFPFRRLFSKDIEDAIHDEDGDLSTLLNFVTNSSPIETKQTIRVLEERMRLEKLMKTIKLKNDIREMRIQKDILVSMKADYKLPEKLSILSDEMAMVCDLCKTTCHFPCNHKWKSRCESMKWMSTLRVCSVCPKNCYPETHKRCSYRYKTYEEKNEEINDQVLKVTDTVENVKDRMQVVEVQECLKVLSENALEGTLLSVQVELDKLIIKEKINGEAGGQSFMEAIERVFE